MSVGTTVTRWGSVADAVAEHGVGQSTLYRWIAEGRVRAERIGPRRIRIDLDSFSEATAPGLPTPTQLVAALAALDQADVDAISGVAGKIVPAADGSAITFAHIWQAIGAVARVQAVEAAPRA